jgi:hypothetical protein
MVIIPHAAYFDAAGKPTGKIITVAGAAAPVKAWITFERDWRKILKREGVSAFHATDFAASLREYVGWKGDKPRRARFLHDLGIVFRNAASRLFSISVEMSAWKSVNSEFLLEETFHSPYVLAGFTVVLAVKKWRETNKITAPIEFFFEEGDEGWGALTKLCKRDGVVPTRRPKSKAIQFEAADLLAWKNRIACIEALKNQPSPDDSIRKTVAALKRIVEDIKSLEKVLVCPGDPLVYGEENLRKTCWDSNVPLRSNVGPVTPIS